MVRLLENQILRSCWDTLYLYQYNNKDFISVNFLSSFFQMDNGLRKIVWHHRTPWAWAKQCL